MKIIITILLILSTFTSIIKAEICYNQTICNMNSNRFYCTTLCPDGCISMNSDNTYCINITSGDPTYSIDFGLGDYQIYKGPFNYSALINFLNLGDLNW